MKKFIFIGIVFLSLFISFFVLKIPLNLFIKENIILFFILFIYLFIKVLNEQNTNEPFFKFSLFSLFFIIITFFYSLPIFHSKEVSSIIKPVEINSTKILPSKNIRKVTREMALVKANKILGTNIEGEILSSQYQVSSNDSSIIKYKNHEYWLFPLEYAGFFKWLNNDKIPGYILVDAINPYKKAKFIKYEFYISPSNYLLSNLKRILLFKFPFAADINIHPEINEKGNLYYISIIYKNKLPYFLNVPNKVIVYDPKTKNTVIEQNYGEFIKNEKFKWVDKISDEEYIKDYVEYHTLYKNGSLNRLFAQKNIGEITGIEKCTFDEKGEKSCWKIKNLWLLNSEKYPNLFWFGGITSLNSNDSSLQYGIAVDSRTMKFYKLSDLTGITDEQGVIESIESKLGANSFKWTATIPLPIIINNQIFWISSIIDKDRHIYIKEAIVDGKDVNKVYFTKDLKDFLNKMKNIQNNNINIKVDKNLATKIINNEKNLTKRRLILEKLNKIEQEIKEIKELIQNN